MKSYTYVKPGLASFVDVDKPAIRKPTDAIVRIVKKEFMLTVKTKVVGFLGI